MARGVKTGEGTSQGCTQGRGGDLLPVGYKEKILRGHCQWRRKKKTGAGKRGKTGRPLPNQSRQGGPSVLGGEGSVRNMSARKNKAQKRPVKDSSVGRG